MRVLTSEELKLELYYNEIVGTFHRYSKDRRDKPGTFKTKKVGTVTSYGYLQIQVKKKQYPAHRLVFLYMTGAIPLNIDHIDGNKLNNSWCNLRECTVSQNGMNKCISIRSSTGVKGLHRNAGGFIAQVGLNGKYTSKTFWPSTYGSVDKAITAAKLWLIETRNKLHGDFANHGNMQTHEVK
jgi:HNH endonuclease